MTTHKKRLALIDQNPATTWLLERNLVRGFQVVKFTSPEEFLRNLDEPWAAVAGDYDTLAEHDALLADPQSPLHRFPWALVTDRKPVVFLPKLEKWQIYCAIPKHTPFPTEQIVPIENLISPMDGFGLMRYFNYTFQMYRDNIRTREEKYRAVERIINHFQTCGYETHRLYDARLVLEEMLNNAFFHAFTDEQGREKYDSQTFTVLDPGEEIYVEFGSDAQFAGFSVCDNQGRLHPRHILSKLSRQVMQEGLLDDSGRGIYLSRLLTSQLIFNIHKGFRTQVICLFYERMVNSLKPLCINYLETPPPRRSSILELAELPDDSDEKHNPQRTIDE
ncbi:MAG: hypothetical protein Kow0059_18670 [Candidatus Sumerlaeia bacterium]